MIASGKSSSRLQPESEAVLQLRSARAWLECLADGLKLDRDGTAMLFPAEMLPGRQIVDIEVSIAQLGSSAATLGDMGGRRVTLAHSLEQIEAALADATAEPAVLVDLGHGRWIVDRGKHAGCEALFFEPAPAPGPFMTPAPVLGPPDTVQPGTVCLRFDRPDAVTYLRWYLATIEDPLRTPADPADFAAAKMFRAYPAEEDDDSPPDASALSRALSMHDKLPDKHRPTDREPLRNCLPGIWPTVGDLRALLAASAGRAVAENHVDRVLAEVNKGAGFGYSRAQVRDILGASAMIALVSPQAASAVPTALSESLDVEERYLTDAARRADDPDGPGLTPGDVEGAFHRVREAAASLIARGATGEAR